MFKAVSVLGLLAFCLGMTHSWDFAVSLREQILLYTIHTNGIQTRTINLSSQNPTALVYDDIRQTILYVDKLRNNDTICGYDLSNGNNKCLIKRKGRDIHGLAFDTITETIFFTDKNERTINFITLTPKYNDSVDENLLFKLDNGRVPTDIAVDSCHEYIYWFSLQHGQNSEISRCRFDGTERNIFQKKYFELFGLTLDLQIQKILYFGYYSDHKIRMVSSGYKTTNELRGIHNRILFLYLSKSRSLTKALTVSKDYVYFTNSSKDSDTVWQITKNVRFDEAKEIVSFDSNATFDIVANYKLVDQISGLQDCDRLASLMPTTTGAPEYTSKKTSISACENYCDHGICSFDDQGIPKCSCDAGYSGEKCQVNVCDERCPKNCTCSLNEENEPICQCKGANEEDGCEGSPCLNYCLQGSCSVNGNGLPECSCFDGYSGDRCEDNVCQGYCLNNGECSLNEENEPVCQCDGNHKGTRCEADISDIGPMFDASKRNQTLAFLLSILRKPLSKMYLTIEI